MNNKFKFLCIYCSAVADAGAATDVINVYNVYKKFFTKRVCYFVNVYYFNYFCVKFRKVFVE